MGATTSVTVDGALLAILSANIQGLCPAKGKYKVRVISETAKEQNVSIICLTETHLCSDHLEAEISIEGFVPFRFDRPDNSKRGGVIIYLKEDLAPGAEDLCRGSNGNIEYLVIQIKTLPLTVIGIYRPPMSDAENFDATLHEIKESVIRQNVALPTVLLTGDLNFPIINWDECSINGGRSSEKRQASALLNFFQEFFMEQFVREPTRGSNILDLVATNDHELVSRVEVHDMQISDHYIMIVKTNIPMQSCSPPPQVHNRGLDSLNFWDSRVDWLSLRCDLRNIEWTFATLDRSPAEIYKEIVAKVTKICLKHVPEKVVNFKTRIPRDRRILMRNRRNINKKLARGVSNATAHLLGNKLKKINAQLILSHEEEIRQEECNAIEKIHQNPKFFFKYARSKAHIKKHVGPIVDLDGETHSDPKEMCELWQNQFESVYSTPINPSNR